MESRQSQTPRPTPLQERLDDLAELIGRVGLIMALLLFLTLAMMESFRVMRGYAHFNVQHFLDYFLLCVAIIVVAVPEGLPLAVTIALAYSQNKMHDDNNQVRRLRACETMGNATQICSDKTGTLTQNVMSVVQGYIGMTYFTVAHPGDVPEPILLSPSLSAVLHDRLVEGIAVNSSSEKVVMSDETKEGLATEPY
uniref:Plasma membrane calcium-transporting ATPase 4 n=1 Tax=Lygus hesperus TaxID=30085 RepID=A0A0A9X5L1_LYGHE